MRSDSLSVPPIRRNPEGFWTCLPFFCLSFTVAYFVSIPGRQGIIPDAGSPAAATGSDACVRDPDQVLGRVPPIPPSSVRTARPTPATEVTQRLRTVARYAPVDSTGATGLSDESAWENASGRGPSVPVPIRSRLLCSANRLGGIDASFLVYEGWGDATSVIDALRDSLHSDGWRRNVSVEALANEELPGVLLSYTRQHERCLMVVSRVPGTGKVETLVLWIRKDWLPPGTGF